MSAPTPPHSLEAEESVIGGVLVHARKFAEVAAGLSADDFYHPALRVIYEAMADLDAASQPIDALTVLERMRVLGTADKLNAVSGADYLTDLMAKVVTAENIGYHARLVRSKAKRRRWVERLRQVVAMGYGDSGDEEFFSEAERAMLELAVPAESESEVRHIKTHLREFADELGERVKRRKGGVAIIGTPTGFGRIDWMLSGLRDGKLYLIAGRPAMGKSALSWTIGANVAAQGVAVLDFSLEMSGQDLVERGVAGEARIDSMKLSQGDLEERGSSIVMWQRITKAVGALATRPMYIVERTDLDVMQIRSLARRWRMTLPPGTKALVKVDYMQLVKAVRRKGQQQNREQDVSEISRGLKLLARELACPVIALSQLNRGLEQRADKRPMLSDLRESGALEQDADVVAFIYRDEVYSKDDCKDEDKGVAEIIVSKQRNGPTGTVRLAWVGAFTRFEELSNREEP